MYERHFGLSQSPFSIAPDPRYLFMSERHREALAHLLYGVRGGGGFVVLTGDIGAGKTTVCRCFLEQIPEHCDVAYIFNPKLTVEELLKTVCGEFRIQYRHDGPGPATVKDYVDALNEHLLRTHAAGQDSVLIIDEAQNLSADVLEQLRLLTNLETNERKLLQIVLIGQPELRDMLGRPELEQLAQRVIARYHLDALGEAETSEYIRHRLAVAGLTRSLPFDRKSLRRIWRYSRGVPRRINLLCDRALLGAYAKGKSDASPRIVDLAAREVLDRPGNSARRATRRRSVVLAGTGLVTAALLAGAVLLALKPAAFGDAGNKMLATLNGSHGAASSPRASAASRAATSAATGAMASSVGRATSASPHGPTAASQGRGVAPHSAPSPPTPAAVAAEPPPFDLPTGFASLIGAEKESWRLLAQQWNVTLGEGDPCAEAAKQRLRCFERSDSTLALVRQLDRPVILKLRDGRNRAAFAVLVGLSDRLAILDVGGTVRTVTLVSLADYWNGEFATYLRVPPELAGLKPGSPSGPGAHWLAQQLAVARGNPAASAGKVDDQTLRVWIHAFQLTQGLRADGVAGPLTLMLLNRAAGIAEPRLRKEN